MKEDFLTYIKSHPAWPYFQKQLLEQRPILIPHNPRNDNTEEWKSLSAQQRGFDLCCAFFEINKE